ncbi:MAG: bifunctional phosphopantothenoylcysteine decarboxylase/phosphopantothenate--cysteine ligase CoaBC, partial [Gammaproteobacteria bacterium]
MDNLNGKRVLLGVTGGIAAYKSPDLVRRLMEAGAEVQVVMTAGAQQFVTALTFQAVSGRPVRTELWDTAAEAAMGHIELARWADLVLVAPATADFMAQLAHGEARDLLSTLCLATEAPLALAPAMNHVMWRHPATQANRQLIEERGVRLIGPERGELAEREIGMGRMTEPRDIVAALRGTGNGPLAGKHVLITAGPTREPLDPVRFISNRSSGKMGMAVAAAALHAGARVTLVCGPVALPAPAGARRIDVETAREMHDAVMTEVADAHIFIGTAAVSDYRPETTADAKIKKSRTHLDLALTRNPDILADVAALEKRPFCVGFAAETDDLEKHAREKLTSKKIDLVAANWVGGGRAFDTDDNTLHAYWPGGDEDLGTGP